MAEPYVICEECESKVLIYSPSKWTGKCALCDPMSALLEKERKQKIALLRAVKRLQKQIDAKGDEDENSSID